MVRIKAVRSHGTVREGRVLLATVRAAVQQINAGNAALVDGPGGMVAEVKRLTRPEPEPVPEKPKPKRGRPKKA